MKRPRTAADVVVPGGPIGATASGADTPGSDVVRLPFRNGFEAP